MFSTVEIIRYYGKAIKIKHENGYEHNLPLCKHVKILNGNLARVLTSFLIEKKREREISYSGYRQNQNAESNIATPADGSVMREKPCLNAEQGREKQTPNEKTDFCPSKTSPMQSKGREKQTQKFKHNYSKQNGQFGRFSRKERIIAEIKYLKHYLRKNEEADRGGYNMSGQIQLDKEKIERLEAELENL